MSAFLFILNSSPPPCYLFFHQPSSLNHSGAAFSAAKHAATMLLLQPDLLTTELSLPHIKHCPKFLDPGTQEEKSDSFTAISCGQGRKDSTKHHPWANQKPWCQAVGHHYGEYSMEEWKRGQDSAWARERGDSEEVSMVRNRPEWWMAC